MRIRITVPCEIDGALVQPDMALIEVRDELAQHLIAQCVAVAAPEDEVIKPVRAKKDRGDSNG